ACGCINGPCWLTGCIAAWGRWRERAAFHWVEHRFERLRRHQLAGGTRHLQLHRRHRQDGAAGADRPSIDRYDMALSTLDCSWNRHRGCRAAVGTCTTTGKRAESKLRSDERHPSRLWRRKVLDKLWLPAALLDLAYRQCSTHGFSNVLAVSPASQGRDDCADWLRIDPRLRGRRSG